MLLLRRRLQQSNTTKLKSFTIPQTTCIAEGTKVEESPQEFVDDAESFIIQHFVDGSATGVLERRTFTFTQSLQAIMAKIN